MVLSTCSQNRTISGNTNEYIHVRYISSNIVPLCKYTLLPATVQVLKSFLEAIFWKSVQFYLGILNDVSSITKALSIQCRFHSRGLVKSNSSVVTLLFAKKSLTKPTGVLEHCHEGESCWFSISRGVSLWQHPKGDEGCQCTFQQIIPAHYGKFWSYYLYNETAVAQWLRCCATERKIAGSIPNDVTGIFHWHNPSDRTMALGSIQPLTEMSTRSISWG